MGVHIWCVVVLDPVQSILRVVWAGNIYTVVLIQDCQRSIDTLRLSYFHRGSVSKRRMLQHIVSVFILSKHEDIKVIILAIRTPVILRGLERVVHLVEPCAHKRGILCDSRHNTASAVIAAGVGTVAGSEHPLAVLLQRRQGDIVFQIVNVRRIPAEEHAVAMGFALCHIGRPVMGEGFGIDQFLLIQGMQPCDTFLPAF